MYAALKPVTKLASHYQLACFRMIVRLARDQVERTQLRPET